ncbi:hypothetical protein NBRC116597_05760 [Phaeobacter sp. NW0010-22]
MIKSQRQLWAGSRNFAKVATCANLPLDPSRQSELAGGNCHMTAVSPKRTWTFAPSGGDWTFAAFANPTGGSGPKRAFVIQLALMVSG